MKYLLTLFLIAQFSAKPQFHIRVEPSNERGLVKPFWLNNYRIAYTVDNWKTKIILHSQIDYVGFDDNAVEYYVSYYQPIAFQNTEQAIGFAKQFKTAESIINYQVYQAKKHLIKTKQYDEARKKLCFNCKDIKEGRGVTIQIK